MARKKYPTKTRVIKKNTPLTSEKKINDDSINKLSNNKRFRNLLIELDQLGVDMYNNCDIYRIDSHFRNFNLYGDKILIRIFKENYIKHKDESNPNDPQYVYGYKMIDARERVTDEPNFIPTPFPYIEKGIIVAISPMVQVKYFDTINKVKEVHNDVELSIPKVGDIVEINSHYSSTWYKEKRYYVDKQEAAMDYVTNPSETSVKVFEHYYLFDDYDLVGISKPEKKFFYHDDNEPEWYKKEKQFYMNKVSEIDDALVNEVSSSNNQ